MGAEVIKVVRTDLSKSEAKPKLLWLKRSPDHMGMFNIKLKVPEFDEPIGDLFSSLDIVANTKVTGAWEFDEAMLDEALKIPDEEGRL